MSPFANIKNVPFDLGMLATLFPDNKDIIGKARCLEQAGTIIRLKNGMYVASPEETGVGLSNELIANHLYGPSYVSRESALRYYGLIPEAVYTTTSMTTKHTRLFENATGRYDYRQCSKEYFPIGVSMQEYNGINYLIATPEKALCDTINLSKALNLRYMKEIEVYLEEDIRFDTEALEQFDISILEACAPLSRKKQTINTLIKFLKHAKRI